MAKSKIVLPLTHVHLLPNIVTAGNLFFGFLSIIRCIQAKYTIGNETSSAYYVQAVWCIFFSAICDTLDGRLARFSGGETLFGKELDSLADVVSFGVAPALMVFFLILSPTDTYPYFRKIGWLVGFIYLLCGTVRLARFNVMTSTNIPETKALSPKRARYFVGLPITAAAATIASIVLVINRFELKFWTLLLPELMLLIAGLMVSNIHYPSFKHFDWNHKTRIQTFLAVAIAGATLFHFREFSFAIAFLTYIFYGIVRHIQHTWKNRHPHLPS
ncbi:MAG: CDP-diacylglycerol--serine O-phosphatidyltransferase [Puniceicoccales bacterium]|jgi:CDP-diacylglycerol--serine O-phosphatidyltransferase|nr:CDP-diacylglycerol--serine O-phosphatidyltransferase [Puniceicoccales bacterium]